MNETDHAWQKEIDRRARVYDDIAARGAWQGRPCRLSSQASMSRMVSTSSLAHRSPRWKEMKGRSKLSRYPMDAD